MPLNTKKLPQSGRRRGTSLQSGFDDKLSNRDARKVKYYVDLIKRLEDKRQQDVNAAPDTTLSINHPNANEHLTSTPINDKHASARPQRGLERDNASRNSAPANSSISSVVGNRKRQFPDSASKLPERSSKRVMHSISNTQPERSCRLPKLNRAMGESKSAYLLRKSVPNSEHGDENVAESPSLKTRRRLGRRILTSSGSSDEQTCNDIANISDHKTKEKSTSKKSGVAPGKALTAKDRLSLFQQVGGGSDVVDSTDRTSHGATNENDSSPLEIFSDKSCDKSKLTQSTNDTSNCDEIFTMKNLEEVENCVEGMTTGSMGQDIFSGSGSSIVELVKSPSETDVTLSCDPENQEKSFGVFRTMNFERKPELNVQSKPDLMMMMLTRGLIDNSMQQIAAETDSNNIVPAKNGNRTKVNKDNAAKMPADSAEVDKFRRATCTALTAAALNAVVNDLPRPISDLTQYLNALTLSVAVKSRGEWPLILQRLVKQTSLLHIFNDNTASGGGKGGSSSSCRRKT